MKRLLGFLLSGALMILAFQVQATPLPPVVTLETSQGNIVLELEPAKAPITTSNFVGYVKSGFFDGLIFHRVINNFMIQGGGFDSHMVKKEGNAPIRDESVNGLTNIRGTIAMARTRVADSATSQFFINLADNDALNGSASKPGYAVFGKVIKGMDIVDKIAKVRTGDHGPYQNVPLEPVVIKKATLVEKP